MIEETLRILLVEDNPGDARLLRELLRESGSLRFELTHVDRLAEAREWLEKEPVDVVLLDLSLPDAHGLDSVRGMLEAAPGTPLIVLTGLDDDATALQAVQAGAQDFLVKGKVEGGLLARSIRYACERKRLDQERAQLLESERSARETAEAAVKARDEMLRVVAHDLGNSLSAMLVTAKVLARTIPVDLAGGTAIRRVENIRTLAEQMQRLRQDLLDVALLESGQLSVEPEPCSAESAVQEALERYRATAEDRSIELTGSVEPGLPAILADEARLFQVIDNLLTNALKFTPQGGSVRVIAAGDANGVRLSICDSGPGIPPEHLPRLFDRFWTTRKDNPTGAGLGLAIARGIVEAHGGDLEVESTPGAGASFHVVLPVAQGGRAMEDFCHPGSPPAAPTLHDEKVSSS